MERQSLKRAVGDAQQRLHQAEAASKDAEAASQSQQDSFAQELAEARCVEPTSLTSFHQVPVSKRPASITGPALLNVRALQSMPHACLLLLIDTICYARKLSRSIESG